MVTVLRKQQMKRLHSCRLYLTQECTDSDRRDTFCASDTSFSSTQRAAATRVGERYNRYGMTLLLKADDGAVYAVRPQWTDVMAPDPEIVLGEQRALFRVTDLLELLRLLDRLCWRDVPEGRK